MKANVNACTPAIKCVPLHNVVKQNLQPAALQRFQTCIVAAGFSHLEDDKSGT